MKTDYIPNKLVHDSRWLYSLAYKLSMTKEELEQSLHSLKVIPDKKMWHQWLVLLLLSLGSGLLLTGIVFFFAYNWEEMHRFTRFAILGSGVIATTFIAFYLGIKNITGQLSLTAAVILTGVLLATFGMVYQTGADSYLFFGSWAVLTIPWVLVSRFQPLWLISFIVMNTALLSWADIHLHSDIFNIQMTATLLGLNGLLLIVREITTLIYNPISEGRWFPSLIVMGIIALITGKMLEMVTHGLELSFISVSYLATMTLLTLFYFKIRRDLFVVALIMASVITVVSAFIGKNFSLFNGGLEYVLIMGVFISLSVAAAVHILLKLSRKWAEANND